VIVVGVSLRRGLVRLGDDYTLFLELASAAKLFLPVFQDFFFAFIRAMVMFLLCQIFNLLINSQKKFEHKCPYTHNNLS